MVPEPCVCSTSMCVHGLSIVHAFAITWGLVCTFYYSFLTSCGMNESLNFHSLYLLSWAGPCLIVGFSFSNPFLTLFVSHLILLSCHPVILAMLLFNLCLTSFFWVCCMLSFCSIPIAQHYNWASTHAVLGFLGPFHHFRASLTHFISLGILSPFQFFIPMGFYWVF